MTTDEMLLSRLEDKLQVIRDRTQGVAEGYSNGMYLWGEGGTGKSHTIEETLNGLGRTFRLTNSRVTARGLFDLLRCFPDAVHIIEDAETIFSDKATTGVLRSALWGLTGGDGLQERFVSWQTAGRREEFVFRGGVIMVANRPLADRPEERAIGTRIPVLEYSTSNEEVAAKMRKIARCGHQHGSYRLSPEACFEVVEEIVSRMGSVQRSLDLRLLVNTFKDRLQWENGSSETDWKELLETRMREQAVPAGGYETRADKKARELDIVHRIQGMKPQERGEVWRKETGKSTAALYRRLSEIG